MKRLPDIDDDKLNCPQCGIEFDRENPDAQFLAFAPELGGFVIVKASNCECGAVNVLIEPIAERNGNIAVFEMQQSDIELPRFSPN